MVLMPAFAQCSGQSRRLKSNGYSTTPRVPARDGVGAAWERRGSVAANVVA